MQTEKWNQANTISFVSMSTIKSAEHFSTM